jgi:hypothetical protein
MGHHTLDEATVRQLYLEEQLSIRAIAALSHVSTRVVYDAMSRYRIPRRRRGHRAEPGRSIDLKGGLLAEATLRRLYTDERRSIAAIAAMLQSSPSRIRNALVRWGIPRRRRGRPGIHSSHSAASWRRAASSTSIARRYSAISTCSWGV